MTGVATKLIAAGRTTDDDELVDFILDGFDEEYNPLVSLVNVMTKFMLHNLNALLVQIIFFDSQIYHNEELFCL
jgi:hypothetical protein